MEKDIQLGRSLEMKRRLFVGGAFAGLSISQTFAAPQKVTAGDIPVITLGKTGLKGTTCTTLKIAAHS
jgi:hypothetical protein